LRMFSAIAQMIFRQELVAFGGGADVVIEGNTVAVQLGEIPQQAAPAAYHIQPHEGRRIIMHLEPPKDFLGIPVGHRFHDFEILLGNIRFTSPQIPLHDALVHDHLVLVHDRLQDGVHALLSPEFLRVHFIRNGIPIPKIHEIHGAVANIAEQCHPFQVIQLVRNGGVPLWKDVCTDDANFALYPLKQKFHLLFFSR
jgi:hypothetical protein